MRTRSCNQFCWVLLFINIHIFNYPDPRLSGLFRVVLTSPDNRGSTVFDKLFVSLVPWSIIQLTNTSQLAEIPV